MALKTSFVTAIACASLIFAAPATWADNWGADTAYNTLHEGTGTVQVITEHSVGQRPLAHAIAAPVPATAPVEPRGFRFRDAGIGAAVTLAATLVLAATLAVRRRRVAQPLV